MNDVPIRGDMIRLGQFLKYAGVAEDGAHAKEILLEADVFVNGERDNRRGRQLFPGDEVNVDGQKLRVASES